MALPLILFAMLSGGAEPPPVASAPIKVTGHQWAPFISPMGQPFRAHTATDDTLADWFYQTDTDRDGYLTATEMLADAERFFAKLDTNHDGQIDPDEIAQYEYEIAPEIQVMSRTMHAPGQHGPVVRQDNSNGDIAADSVRGPHRESNRDRRERAEEDDASLGIGGALQGAARYSLLNIPEPVAAADTNFDRLITLQEFREAALARFALLDTAHRGKITLSELEAMPHVPSNHRHHYKIDENALDPRIGDPLPTGP